MRILFHKYRDLKFFYTFLIIISVTGCNNRFSVVETSDSGNYDVENTGDTKMPKACEEGKQECIDNTAVACINGENILILDCRTNGWICENGICTETSDETETERAYRLRFFELRLENAKNVITLDRFGGWKNFPSYLSRIDPRKFFKVQKVNNIWWFITPEGYPFISKGVTDVNYLGSKLSPGPFHDILVNKYGSEEVWAEASLTRFNEWAFNTIGPWSSQSIAQNKPHTTIILDAAGNSPRYKLGDIIVDYWSSGFEENVKRVVEERVTHYIQDEFLIGYFLDNELYWVPDWRATKTLLQLYLDFPPEAIGRKEALKFLRNSVSDIDEFNTVWKSRFSDWDELETLNGDDLNPETEKAKTITESFLLHAFRKYASTTVDSLRKLDPNHLILGCRFAVFPGEALLLEAAKYFDVISLAGYHENWVDELDVLSLKADKPFFIEEFSFKAKDSGLPNVMNYAQVVETQKDRALAYDKYVQEFIRRPYAVAYHWYKWFDNPPEENNPLAGDNFGIMNYKDKPYSEFIKMVREVNIRAEFWHAGINTK